MLLLNKTLLRMAKGLWRWIFLITGLKLAVLVGLAAFARIISGFLGNVASPAMTAGDGARAVVSALLTAVIILLLELLTGEAQYRCTAKARQTLRGGIFSKVLELDVGNVEKIGPVSAITSSVDGVESMQVYYSQYLPGLFYSLLAPIYLFFQLWKVSLAPAVKAEQRIRREAAMETPAARLRVRWIGDMKNLRKWIRRKRTSAYLEEVSARRSHTSPKSIAA